MSNLNCEFTESEGWLKWFVFLAKILVRLINYKLSIVEDMKPLATNKQALIWFCAYSSNETQTNAVDLLISSLRHSSSASSSVFWLQVWHIFTNLSRSTWMKHFTFSFKWRTLCQWWMPWSSWFSCAINSRLCLKAWLEFTKHVNKVTFLLLWVSSHLLL